MTQNWGNPQHPQHPQSPAPPAYPPSQAPYPGAYPHQPPQAVLPYRAGPCCPKCGTGEATPISFTWWGGLIGPKLLHHVRCQGCGYAYNGKTGRPNTTGIIVYSVVLAVIAIVIFAIIGGVT